MATGADRDAHEERRRRLGRQLLRVSLSVGTIRVLTSVLPKHAASRNARAVDVALLIAGNAIGIPYLVLMSRLHRAV